jgi:outer membrane protein assembly factor BamB
MRFQKLILYSALLIVFCGCTKNYPNPGISSPGHDNPNGIFYINVVGYFIKLDASNDSVYWWSQVLNLFNSADNPMTFDSNYFYHGNYTSMSCYSTATGLPVWSFNWLAFNDAISYREPVFNDSLIFFTSPTSAWDHGYLFCKNKRTGTSLWQKQLDFGGVYTSFNGIPVLNGDKVITLTRDLNDQKHLTAFSIQDGNQQWSIPVSNSMSSKLWLINGRLYSAHGPEAVCYDASTGQLLWQTNMNVPAAWWAYNFFDNDRLIAVKVLDNSHYTILQIQKDNGTIIRSSDLVIPTTYSQFSQVLAPLGCSYKASKLYIASFNAVDSLDIFCYDITSMSQQWKIRIANNLLTGQAPVLTDKYLVFPVNDQYNSPDPYQSKMIFLDHSGKLVNKVPFHSAYTDGFIYKENGVIYGQPRRF